MKGLLMCYVLTLLGSATDPYHDLPGQAFGCVAVSVKSAITGHPACVQVVDTADYHCFLFGSLVSFRPALFDT